MKRIENRCIDCATDRFPCRGRLCPFRNAEVHYCEKCGEELQEVFDVDGEELCEECLKAMFKKE